MGRCRPGTRVHVASRFRGPSPINVRVLALGCFTVRKGEDVDSFEVGVVIDRPMTAVWEYLNTTETELVWHSSAVERVPVTDGPLAKGSRVRQVDRFLGRRIETEWEVTELEGYLRRVHWPSTAKRDELMIRQLETPWQSRALVFFDARGSSYDSVEGFEKGVSGAASVIRHLLTSGFDADLWTGGAPISSADPDSYAKSMEALAGVKPADGLDLRAAALRLQRGGRGGALVLVTGIPDGELLAVGQLLTRNFASTVLMSVSQQASATLASFQRGGTLTMSITPEGSWAGAWLKATSAPWPTVSAG